MAQLSSDVVAGGEAAGVSPSRSRGGRGPRGPRSPSPPSRSRRKPTTTTATAAEATTTATSAIPAEAAASTAAAEAATIAAEAATAITVATALVAVGLAHLDGGLGLARRRGREKRMTRQAHAPLHLGDGGGRRIDVQERIVGFAVLFDLEGNGLHAPVLGLGDLSPAVLDHLGIFFGERFDLRLRNVLACQEYVLIQRHGLPFLLDAFAPAQSPF
jgi:hypothetical protein